MFYYVHLLNKIILAIRQEFPKGDQRERNKGISYYLRAQFSHYLYTSF